MCVCSVSFFSINKSFVMKTKGTIRASCAEGLEHLKTFLSDCSQGDWKDVLDSTSDKYAIYVTPTGDGTYQIIDGNHRFQLALQS